MQRQYVDEIMGRYKENQGRHAFLGVKISAMNAELDRLKAEREKDIIYASGGGEKGLPSGGQVSDPTARKAIQIITGVDTEDMAAIKREIKSAADEMVRIKMEIAMVDGWVGGLKERERFVINLCTLEGLTYKTAGERYREKYGYDISKDTLRKTKKEAMERVYEMAR